VPSPARTAARDLAAAVARFAAALLRPLVTVTDRIVRGPFAPSEAALATVVLFAALLLGGVAGIEAGWTGVGVALGSGAVSVAVLAYRDRRARIDRADGRRRP
jgi:hypothetical protein